MLNRILLTVLLLGLVVAGTLALAAAQTEEKAMTDEPGTELRPEDKLVVLWTSGDPEVATRMAFMYVGNAPRFDWWDDITLIVWGPSAKLLAGDENLQGAVRAMERSGVKLEACKACADQYDVSDKLTECGIDVKYMGDVLTGYIKEGRHVLTI